MKRMAHSRGDPGELHWWATGPGRTSTDYAHFIKGSGGALLFDFHGR